MSAIGILRKHIQRNNAQNNGTEQPVREKTYSRSAFGFIRRKLDWNQQRVEQTKDSTEKKRVSEKHNFLAFLGKKILNNNSLTTQEKLSKLLQIEYVFENISVFSDDKKLYAELQEKHPDIAKQMSALVAICTHPELKSESKYFLTRRLSANTEQAEDIKSILNKKKNELIAIRQKEAEAMSALKHSTFDEQKLQRTVDFITHSVAQENTRAVNSLIFQEGDKAYSVTQCSQTPEGQKSFIIHTDKAPTDIKRGAFKTAYPVVKLDINTATGKISMEDVIETRVHSADDNETVANTEAVVNQFKAYEDKHQMKFENIHLEYYASVERSSMARPHSHTKRLYTAQKRYDGSLRDYEFQSFQDLTEKLTQLLNGLQGATQAGVIVRDFKRDNIFMLNGTCYLADMDGWRLAKDIPECTPQTVEQENLRCIKALVSALLRENDADGCLTPQELQNLDEKERIERFVTRIRGCNSLEEVSDALNWGKSLP